MGRTDDDADTVITVGLQSDNTNDPTRVSEGGTLTLTITPPDNSQQITIQVEATPADPRIRMANGQALSMIQTTNQKTISLAVNKDRFDNPQSKYTLILKVPKDQQDDYLLTTTDDRSAGRPPTAYLELSITINQDGLPKLLTQFIPATTKEGSTVGFEHLQYS